MGLIFAENLYGMIKAYRVVWISGRFGGGKTSLALELSRSYLKQGYKLAANINTIWRDELESIEPDENHALHTVFLLDEGGLLLEDNRDIKRIIAYAAKMDIILLIPSVFPPPRLASAFTIQPVFNLTAIGIPYIHYTWQIKMGMWSDKGWFAWWDPKSIFGIYDRLDPGGDVDEIIEFVQAQVKRFRGAYGYESRDKGHDGFSAVAAIEQALEKLDELVYTQEEENDRFSERAKAFFKKRKRF